MNELKLNFNVQSHECAIDFFKCQKMRLGEKWRRSLGLTSSGRLWRFMADGAWFIGTGGPGRTDRWCTFRWRRPQREFHAQRRRNDRQQRHRQGKCRAMQIFLIMQNDGHFQKKCYFLFVWIFFKSKNSDWRMVRFRPLPHCSGQVPATSGRSRVREEPHIQRHHLPGKLLQTETMKTVNKWIGYRRSLTWCWRRRKVAKSCAATIDSKDTARTWWTWSPNVWELNVTQFSVTGNEEGVERFIGANFVWGTRKIDFRVGQDAKATLAVSVLT